MKKSPTTNDDDNAATTTHSSRNNNTERYHHNNNITHRRAATTTNTKISTSGSISMNAINHRLRRLEQERSTNNHYNRRSNNNSSSGSSGRCLKVVLLATVAVLITLPFYADYIVNSITTNDGVVNKRFYHRDCKDYHQKQHDKKGKKTSMAILVLTYNRATYLQRTLESLFSLQEVKCGVDDLVVYISQDDAWPEVTQTIERFLTYTSKYFPNTPVVHLTHLHMDNSAGETTPPTVHLARHYKWALNQVFTAKKNHDYVVIVEDDMEFSPDFMTLFEETAPLLQRDSSLWCVSSWNDLGHVKLYDNSREEKEMHDINNKKLFRTDYFPGLGWMMPRKIWLEELRDKWPKDHWDHWMRLKTISKGRECIVPKLSRNHNFGVFGATVNSAANTFYQTYIQPNERATEHVQTFGDLSYLLESNYEKTIIQPLTTHSSANINIVPHVTRNSIQQIYSGIHHQDQSKKGAVSSFLKKLLFANKDNGSTNNQKYNSQNMNARFQRKIEQKKEAILQQQEQSKEKNEVYIIPYDLDTYRTILAPIFVLMPTPRGTHRGATFLQITASTWIIFADKYSSPYLPEEYKIQKHPELEIIKGREGEPCDGACLRYGMTCIEDQLPHLNDCDVLRKYFPCEKGCIGGIIGGDIPNYITHMEKGHRFYQHCIANPESTSFCNASHWSAKRLCPCVSRKFHPNDDFFYRNQQVFPVTSREGESCNDACARSPNINAMIVADILKNQTTTTATTMSHYYNNLTSTIVGTGSICSPNPNHFTDVNHCDVLKEHFPCEKGCLSGITGSDVPNYVSNPQKTDMYKFCLTTTMNLPTSSLLWGVVGGVNDNSPSCDASHWSARRICPCVSSLASIRLAQQYRKEQNQIKRRKQYPYDFPPQNPQMIALISRKGESCTQTCAKGSKVNHTSSLYCSSDHFKYVNDCQVLQRHFPCSRGCQNGMLGSDIPNYVTDMTKRDLYKQCLTTDHLPHCNASHVSSKRLCPCLPKV